MHFDLIDTLRCLAPHEESWLVAAADRTAGRHIVDGVLGCPVCKARYPIVGGVADFTGGSETPAAGAAAVSDEDAMKLAALLDLTDARGYVLLVGGWAALAAPLRELVQIPVLAVNAPRGVEPSDEVSLVRTAERVPVAAGSARGAALDAGLSALAASAVTAVRAGGRVVGEAGREAEDVEVLARDERHWVGTRRGGRETGPLLQLVRTPG